MLNLNSRKILKHFSYICFILSPVILLAILSFILKQNAFAGRPIWSDEIGFWREIYSFVHYGFKTGYIGINELTPKIGCFSTHGFFPALLYFPFAKVLNWPENGIVLANMLFTAICFLGVVFILRPSAAQTFCFLGVYLFFTPAMWFALTAMTEMLNYGLLSLFFASFYKVCVSDGRTKKVFLILTLIFGTICCFYRIIYIVLLLAPVFALSDFHFSRKFAKLFLFWILYSGGLYFVVSLFTAPYPFGVLYSVMHTSNVKAMLDGIRFNFINNVKNLFSLNSASKIEVSFRLICLMILTIYFGLIFIKIAFKKSRKNFMSLSLKDKPDAFYVIQFCLLFFPLVIILLIYDVHSFREYRTLAPILWISVVNLVIHKRFFSFKFFSFLFGVFFIFNLKMFPQPNSPEIVNRFIKVEKRDFQLIQTVIKYNEDAENPFENTLATDNWFNFELWSNLHPGIGIQWLYERPLENLKSKYLLLNTDQPIEGYEQQGLTDFGCLYIKN